MNAALNVASSSRSPVALSWRRAFAMSRQNLRRRPGRFALMFACIAIAVAFLMAALTDRGILAQLLPRDDAHTRAVLDRAGHFTADVLARQRQADEQVWMLALAGLLCLVGITNTMLMSVSDRAREIGTIKCLGAPDPFVVRLFLLESVCVGMLGSVVGALAGFALTLVQVGCGLEFALLSGISLASVLANAAPLAIGAGTALSVLAAIYPASVVAKMKPVDAMRVEV